MSWKNPFSKYRSLVTALLLSIGGMSLTADQAEAHFPFRHHHYWGIGHWGHRYYSPFALNVYTYRPWLYRSYSVGYYSAPMFYYSYPTYYVPTYYYSVPTISWPISTYYVPFCATNVTTPTTNVYASNVSATTSPFMASNTWSNRLNNLTGQVPTGQGALLPPATQDVNDPSIRLVSTMPNARAESDKPSSSKLVVNKKPGIVEPYSPVWTKAAVGLVDDMIRDGRLDDAVASCKSMEKISQSKGAAVYLRQGITSFFAHDANESTKLDKALSFMDLALRGGAELTSTELPKGSLTGYLSPCSVDVQSVFDQLSERILEKPNTSMKELLLLSVLLRLDGQSERSKLFASEAQSWVSANPRWQNLLRICLDSSTVQ